MPATLKWSGIHVLPCVAPRWRRRRRRRWWWRRQWLMAHKMEDAAIWVTTGEPVDKAHINKETLAGVCELVVKN